MEQFANNCSAIVASGGYTAGSGVLNVNSTAAPWPQVGDFRIAIFGQNTNSLKVILKVTAINSATQFAVTAEGTDADTDEGDVANGCVITAGVMKNIGWVLLEEKTASNSASLNFANWYSTLYDEYIIELLNLIPATDAQPPYMRFSVNGGSSYDSGNYYDWFYHVLLAGVHTYETGNDQPQIVLGLGQQDSETVWGGVSGRLTLYNPQSTSFYKQMCGKIMAKDNRDSRPTIRDIGVVYHSTSAMNAFTFLFASGNITSGTIRVYGVAK